MKRTSLVARLVLLQRVLAAALIVVFAVSTIWISAHTLDRQEEQFLQQAAAHLTQTLMHEWSEEHDLGRAAASVVEEDAPLGTRVDILDEQGRLLASTAASPAPPAEEMRTTRVHAPPGAWIVVSMSRRPQRNAVAALGLALLVAALPLFLVVSALGRRFAQRALRPLSRMAAQAEQTTASNAMLPLGSPADPEEVAALSAAFDRLLGRLNEMIRAERHFTEDAAHELRTPLTVLSGELEYALTDTTLGPRSAEGLHRAWDQVRAMTDLVEALLFLRRSDTGHEGLRSELAPVNLADLVRETVGALATEHPNRNADVTVDADDEVLVAGHAILLASALRNLVSNALKFTEPGQPVRITVRAGESPCRVVVDDDGKGVAAAEREAIFDAFYRSPEARANHRGFGLGLPILRRVARAHGGDVELSPSPLGGARFVLRLPAWTPGA